MSYRNFDPDVFGPMIMKELKIRTILVPSCHDVYKGEITKAGDTITFESLGDPTIKKIAFADRNKPIGNPEMLDDSRLTMEIREIRVLNTMIGDIDEKIANGSIKAMIREKIPGGIGLEADKYVAEIMCGPDMPNAFEGSGGFVTVGGDNEKPLDLIDKLSQKLFENNVPETDEVTFFVSPHFYRLCKQAVGALDTDNSEILKLGKVRKYNDVILRRTNAVLSKNGADQCCIKTKDCIGFAGALREIEACRPSDLFADVIKGLYYFDAKVINPKKGFVVPIKYAPGV